MTDKENALRIIRFDRPERVMSYVPRQTLCYQGCNHEGYDGGGHDCPVGSKWTDIWGVEWHKEQPEVMGFPRVNPLANMNALKTYQWPDPNDERLCGKIYKMAAETPRSEDAFICGSNRDTLWEKSYLLVGMENMMTYFYAEPEFAREVLHRIMDFQLGMAKHYLKLGCEMVGMSDDLGTQNGPLLGPAIVKNFLVQEYRRLFELYKKNNVLVHFHSCGNVEAMLPIFMELGVDILNPIQATANDLGKLRASGGKRIAFEGGISTALLIEGPVERIKQDVKEKIKLLGAEGGYFCCPDQGMPTPPEHLAAMEQAVQEYGKYSWKN